MSRRWLASLTGALLLGSLLAPPAAAHDTLVASDPPDGATLDAAPESIVLEFSADILELNPGMEITGPDGAQVELGEAQVDGPSVTWDVVGELGGGQHDVVWVVTSSDGHPIDGELSFIVEPVETAEPEPVETPEPEPVETPEPTATAAPAPEEPDVDAIASSPDQAEEADPADLSDNAEAWFFGGLAVTALVVVAVVLVMRRNRDPNGPPGQH